MRMGQTISSSSPPREFVVDGPLDPQDVAATIDHHLGIDARSVHFYDALNRRLLSWNAEFPSANASVSSALMWPSSSCSRTGKIIQFTKISAFRYEQALEETRISTRISLDDRSYGLAAIS